MIARSIFNPNKPFLRVINTIDRAAVISNTLDRSENLSNCHIFSIDEVNANERNRKAEISKLVMVCQG